MMRLSVLLVSLLFVGVASGKGRAWSYTMEGYAYDQTTMDVLRNTSLMIGEHPVTTDGNGWYAVVIEGVSCDMGRSREDIDRCNEEAFGQLMVRRLVSDATITIPTNWKEHACINRVIFTPPCFLSRRDLFVP